MGYFRFAALDGECDVYLLIRPDGTMVTMVTEPVRIEGAEPANLSPEALGFQGKTFTDTLAHACLTRLHLLSKAGIEIPEDGLIVIQNRVTVENGFKRDYRQRYEMEAVF